MAENAVQLEQTPQNGLIAVRDCGSFVLLACDGLPNFDLRLMFVACLSLPYGRPTTLASIRMHFVLCATYY